MVWFYAAADDLLIVRNLHAVFIEYDGFGIFETYYFSWRSGNKTTFGIGNSLQEMVGAVAFGADDFLFKPLGRLAFEYDQTVFVFVHDFLGFQFQFLEFHFRNLALKNRILYPVQVFAA